MNTSEIYHLKRILVTNIFKKQVCTKDILIEDIVHDDNYCEVTILPSIFSTIAFAKRTVRYEKFRLADYKFKEQDQFLIVPKAKGVSPVALINYMNEVYVNSVNVVEHEDTNNILKGFQRTLSLLDLNTFTLNNPEQNTTVFLSARNDSLFFSGNLTVKFI